MDKLLVLEIITAVALLVNAVISMYFGDWTLLPWLNGVAFGSALSIVITKFLTDKEQNNDK